ncbi:MAG: bifunctional alpha,alpha-trehalose-phosphate synthase (UDP-forming)/trehalose-phosphatase [Proteobacteria bacterium]|nr:bifunctional alpha,alpha-trehalose-phosphate synthase (UDP-forming)/trehalose-phosphatase [Pseudomonadota bacterium]
MVASNRLPFTLQRTARGIERRHSPGGLVSALEPVLRARGGTWVGWPGMELRAGESIPDGETHYDVATISLSESEVSRYYHGFCNRTLWPLLHSMPGLARFEARDFETYARVNDRFADAVLETAGPDDLVWVHDYQLALSPARIRQRAPDTRLAYFLHIPFPPYDIFRLLPWDRELLLGLLACDLVGFHVPGYVDNFLNCVEQRLGARVDRQRQLIEHGDRMVRVGAFPIGIEYEHFEQRAREAPAQPETQRERVVLGVDRLDYTKGIPERISAFARLLERYPEHRERVVLLQVAVPSRSQVAEYKQLKREIDELVGRVNGRFATASWSPIRYLYRSIDPTRLAALYRDAHVALVSPLRDGMNLVAKEFVACQTESPGVLVLSRLAGAGETMREALLVNPYNVDETAEALHRALKMDETERRSRMEALRARELRDNVQAWVGSFLESAEASMPVLAPLSDTDFHGWLDAYLTRPHLALFLDYDGTLTELVGHPSEARLSPAARQAVTTCSSRPDTDVAIVTGRALADIQTLLKAPELTYAGNHGLEIQGPDGLDFRHDDLVHYAQRTDTLARALEEVARDGAWVEPKGPTLTFHYRAVAADAREPLIERARELITGAGYQARAAHEALEARPPIGWDKGRAVLHVLRSRYGPAWSERVRVLYVGDDETDEDAFRFLAGLAMTFRVGPAHTLTAASHRLAGVGAVLSLVDFLARR